MTKDQVAGLIEQIPQFLTPDEFLVALATKAAEVEREACAKVCDEWGQAAGMYLAATIRERSKK